MAKADGVDGPVRAEYFEFVEDHYYDAVGRLVAGGARLQDAEDAANDAFISGLRYVETNGWQRVRHPKAWFNTAVRNAYVRIRQRNNDLLPAGDEQMLDGAFQEHEPLSSLAMDVLAAIRGMPEQPRKVILLHICGDSAEEIARKLRITRYQVADRLKLARRRLRQELELSPGGRRREA